MLKNNIKDKDFLIKADKIIKNYGNYNVLDVENIIIKKGDRIGIIGSNGSSKTTLIEILSRIRPSSIGSSKIIHKQNLIIGMQTQESQYIKGITANQLIDLYINTYNIIIDSKKMNSLINKLSLWNFINKSINSLSGGQKQRINILLSIIINPDIIILDEFSTGLDVIAKDNVFEILNNFLNDSEEKSLIIVSHNMSEIENFTNIIWLMHKGKIINILKTKDIISEFGNMENFIRKNFKYYEEYKNVNNSNITSKEDIDVKWSLKWDKKNEIRKKYENRKK